MVQLWEGVRLANPPSRSSLSHWQPCCFFPTSSAEKLAFCPERDSRYRTSLQKMMARGPKLLEKVDYGCDHHRSGTILLRPLST